MIGYFIKILKQLLQLRGSEFKKLSEMIELQFSVKG